MTPGGRSDGLGDRGLRALLAPRAIAVVGASRDPAKWGRRVLEFSHRAGYPGRLYGVTTATADLGLPGVRTVPDLAAIDGPVDLAVIARPAAAVPAIIADCAAAGVGAALVTAAGFGELGGQALNAEQAMCATARAAGMRVLGPNTFGLFVADQAVNLTPREHIPAGQVTLLTQSGNVAVALYELARQAGIGFSACVGVGNQADIDFGDLLTYFAADAASAAIAVYAEGLRGSGDSFRTGLAACRAAGKPVVVLKAGRSAQAARAAATHTGALAADDRIWQAVLAEAGALRVTSTQDLIDTLTLVTSVPAHSGRVMVITDGGGDSVLASDALADAGLAMAEPSAATRARLDELVPPDAPRTQTRNPVTLDTAGGVEDDPLLLAACASAVAGDDGVDAILIGGLFGGYPRLLEGELASAQRLIELHAGGVPVAVQSAFASGGSKPVQALREAGLPVLPDVSRLARALAATARPQAGTGQGGLPHPAHATGSPSRAGSLSRAGSPSQAGSPSRDSADGPGGTAQQGRPLPVQEVAVLLREHGVTLPEMTIVSSPAELAAVAATAPYPACLKVSDPAITHKSDVGGVRLRLTDPAALIAAGKELGELFPGSPLLVMPFLLGGQELLVGTGSDPVFGPYVLVGRGGIWAETDPDIAIVLAPASEESARQALLGLRCTPMLTGGRGTDPVDLDALTGLVAAMSRLGARHPDLSVEMNPVIAYPDGYAVADLRASAVSDGTVSDGAEGDGTEGDGAEGDRTGQHRRKGSTMTDTQQTPPPSASLSPASLPDGLPAPLPASLPAPQPASPAPGQRARRPSPGSRPAALTTVGKQHGQQPYEYPPKREFAEPDWRRIPGFRDVSEPDWLSARWQRQHTVRSVRQLREVLQHLLPATLADSIVRDQDERATMSLSIPPHMLSTMTVEDLWHDPIRRYLAPAFDERDPEFPSHPMAARDSLHEADMWMVEGLTHKYPTKVLCELLTTCPQYCGHCTRMDLVGLDVPKVAKRRIEIRTVDRYERMLDYLRATPSVRDVVVSGGDIANVPIGQLEDFLVKLFAIESIHDVRLATKGLIGLPQYFLQDDVLRAFERISAAALACEVELAVHTHLNHANSVTPLVARAVSAVLGTGVRDVRNQAVLLRGVNATQRDILDLCFTMRDKARVMPYYVYMCDMVPSSEHWRTSLAFTQELQNSIMGYLPGFATPRFICDPPYLGKRWVHQNSSYDRVLGISGWIKNYRTPLEAADDAALSREYLSYDPIDTLPEEGREYWRRFVRERERATRQPHLSGSPGG